MKTLIAWFSWSGNTEKIAHTLQEKTNGDLFRIERLVPYSTDYNTCAYKEAKGEKEGRVHPAIRGPLPDLSGYDNVLLAFPIWWYTMPMPVLTFLESCPDWKRKTIWLFANSYTDDPTYMDNAMQDAGKAAKNADVRRGLFNKEISGLDEWIRRNLG